MTTTCLPCELAASTAEDVVPETEEGAEVASWSGPIGIEQQRTGDGRLIVRNALRWDTLPVPLRWTMQDFGAHDGAYVVGKIETIERLSAEEASERLQATGRDPLPEGFEGTIIWGAGVYDLGSEHGREAYRQVKEGLTPGISMDLDDIVVSEEDKDSFEIREGRIRAATQVAIPAFEGARIAVSDAGKAVFDADAAEFNWVEDVGGLPKYIKRIEKHLEAKGMDESQAIATAVNVVTKMCATGDLNFPGSQEINAGSRAEACAAVEEWEAKKAKANADAAETIVASAAAPPAEWFRDPGLAEPTGLTVTEDGRVYGHIALWGTCHIANPRGHKVCTEPPRSLSNYAYFRTGLTTTTAGDVPTGKITMSTLHAGERLSSNDAIYHYEHTGSVGADVVAGEDSFGIWVAGAARAGADLVALKAAPVSGDWRNIGGTLEMVGALSVNVPGFPVPRTKALIAGGAVQSLVASGVVEAETRSLRVGEAVINVAADLSDDALLALRERFRAMDRKEAADALAAKVARLAALEKVRRVAKAVGTGYNGSMFAFNPDQARVPQGNGRLSGRWLDTPDVMVEGLIDNLIAGRQDDPDYYTDDLMAGVEGAQALVQQAKDAASPEETSDILRDAATVLDTANTEGSSPEAVAAVQETMQDLNDYADVDWSLGASEADIGAGEMKPNAGPQSDDEKIAHADLTHVTDEAVAPEWEGSSTLGLQELLRNLQGAKEAGANLGQILEDKMERVRLELIKRRMRDEKRSVTASGSFAYNEDQWRVPKGNPKGGQWIDMPDLAVKDLEANLTDMFENIEVDDATATRIGDSLADAVNLSEQSSAALSKRDGEGASGAAAEADESLAKVEAELQNLADSGALDEQQAAMIGEKLDAARDSVSTVADADLSLLGDESIGGEEGDVDVTVDEGSDVTADEGADIGAEAPAPEASNGLAAGKEIPLADLPEPVRSAIGENEADGEERIYESTEFPGAYEVHWTDPDTGEVTRTNVADAEGNVVGDTSGGPGYIIYNADGSTSPKRYDTVEEAAADLPGLKNGTIKNAPVTPSVGTDAEGNPEAPDTSIGSAQQQQARKVDDSASRLEAVLQDAAEGELPEGQAEAVGAALDELRERITSLNEGIQDGNFDANELSRVHSSLGRLESVLMAAADEPGLSDATANGIGQALDDVFAEVSALDNLMKGSTEPPPFAGRKYVRQWLGRRGFRLDGSSSLI